MKLNIGILEDDETDYQLLYQLLEEWGKQTGNIVQTSWFFTEETIYTEFEHAEFHLLFSDIDLNVNNQNTGIEICTRLRTRGYQGGIIFLTAYREYVFRGYDVNAFQYLVKPLSRDILFHCMDRFVHLHMSDFYYYHKNQSILQINYHDIICFSKDGHDVIIQTVDTQYIERISLNDIERRLPPNFIRCHKSCIINIQHVRSIDRTSVVLSNKTFQNIGRNYLAAIRSAFLELSKI